MNKKIVSIAMFALLTIILLAPFIPTAKALNDPPNDGLPHNVTGDWIVDSERYYGNSTAIHMLNGNVTVKSGSSLTLDNAALDFAPASNGAQGIFVEGGGYLYMKGNAIISSVNVNSYNCVFYQGSGINVTLGRIYSAGGAVPNTTISAGIYVGTGKAVFDRLIVISQLNAASAMRIDGKGVLIKNSTIQSGSSLAIDAYGDFDMYDSVVTRIGGSVNYDGVMAFGANTTLLNNRIQAFDVGVALQGGKHVFNGNKINNDTTGFFTDGNAVITMNGNEINNNTNNGMVGRYTTFTSKGNFIHRNGARGMDLLGVQMESKDDVLFDNTNENMMISGSTVNMTRLTFTKNTAGIGINGGQDSNLMIKDSTMTHNAANSLMTLVIGTTVELRNNTLRSFGSTAVIAYTSKLTLIDNNLTSLSGGASPLIAGVEDVEIASSHNGYNGINSGILIQNHGKVTSYDDTFTTAVANAEAFLAGLFAKVEAHNTKATLGATGALGQILQAEATFYDCTLETTASTRMLEAVSNSHILSVSSNPDIDNVTAVSGSKVDIAWWTEVLARWQNQVPAANASIYINDTHGENMVDMETGADGTVKGIVVSDTRVDTGILRHNDYRVTALKNGTKVWRTQNISNDLVGGNRIVLQFTDPEIPQITIGNPVDGLITNKAHILINGTASDVGSGLDRVEVNNGTGWVRATGLEAWSLETNLTEGTIMLDARATDMAGQIKNASISVLVDLTKPTIEVSEPGDYVTTSGFNLTGLTEAGSAVVVDGAPAIVDGIHFSKVMNFPDGPHDIVINATDLAGNTYGIVKHVIVDTIAPTLTTDIANGGWVNVTSCLFKGKSDGDNITVNGIGATIDTTNGTYGALITLVDGPNNVTVIATDLAGNENRTDINVNVDRIPPVLNVSYPEADALGIIYINSNELIVRGVVEGADILLLEGTSVTIGDNGTFVANLTVDKEMSEVTLLAKDLAGNTDHWTHTVIKDTVAPVVTITSPAQGFATNQAAITVMGRVDDRTADISYGDTLATNDNGVFSFTATLTDGSNEIMVTARDLAENIGTATITVVLDTVADLSVTSMTENETSTKDDVIKIAGTSEAGAKVYINDALISNADGTFSYDWPLQPGENTLTVKVVDKAGNEKTMVYKVTKKVESPSAMSTGTGGMLLAIILLIVGIVVGVAVGKAMSKPKGPAPRDDYYPPKPERVEQPRRTETPAREERRFPERPREEPKPERKAAPPAPTPTPAPAPAKAEVREARPEPRPEPRDEPKAKGNDDEDLDDLLKRLK